MTTVCSVALERRGALLVLAAAAAAALWLEFCVAGLDANLARRACEVEGLALLVAHGRGQPVAPGGRLPASLAFGGHRFAWRDTAQGPRLALEAIQQDAP